MSAMPPEVERALLEAECARAGVLDVFHDLLSRGNTQRMAALLAMRKSPACRGTDAAFFSGRICHGDALDEEDHAEARRHGIDTSGKVYVRGLADWRGPGDPRAWVSSTSDVLRRARELNVTVNGSVSHKAVPAESVPDCPLAEKHVQAMMKREAALNGGEFNKLSLEDKRAHVIEKYGRRSAIAKWNEYQRRRRSRRRSSE